MCAALINFAWVLFTVLGRVQVMQEKRALRHLDHNHIVKLHFTFQDPNSLYYVLELASGGELFEHLQKARSYDVAGTRFIAAEILLAVFYMHRQGVLHRDLKPEV